MATLVLTRKATETIRIGDDVRVTVIKIGRSAVKLKVEAPPAVRVDREEVFQRRRTEAGRRLQRLTLVG